MLLLAKLSKEVLEKFLMDFQEELPMELLEEFPMKLLQEILMELQEESLEKFPKELRNNSHRQEKIASKHEPRARCPQRRTLHLEGLLHERKKQHCQDCARKRSRWHKATWSTAEIMTRKLLIPDLIQKYLRMK